MPRAFVLSARVLALNTNAEQLTRLIALARTEPEWAAFTLLKMIFLKDGLDPTDDAALAARAGKRREDRMRRGGRQ